MWPDHPNLISRCVQRLGALSEVKEAELSLVAGHAVSHGNASSGAVHGVEHLLLVLLLIDVCTQRQQSKCRALSSLIGLIVGLLG